jgi:hypothetical protein
VPYPVKDCRCSCIVCNVSHAAFRLPRENIRQRDEALAAYRRALSLDGANAAAREGIQRLEKNNLELTVPQSGILPKP